MSQNWLSSLDLKEKLQRRTSTSSHGAVILGSLSSPVSSQDPDWYKRIACCQLTSGRGIGQGVLVHLDQFSEAVGLGENLQLGLLTNHHIIPHKRHVVDWKLHIGPEGKKKMFTLNESNFTHCFSCCGPDGIWGGEPHFQQSASDPPISCPVGRDFSLLVLAQAFASELGSKLFHKDNPLLVFPPLRAHGSCCTKFCILQREESGGIAPDRITLQAIAPPTDDSSLERELIAYKESCILRYQHDWPTQIGKGSSGSGIFCYDQRSGDITLAGIHVSSEVEDGQMHYGLTVHAIVHSIAGGPTCGIIPALSLLKDASIHNCLATRWYDNLQSCLNPEESDLNKSLKIVDFLLKVERPSIFRFTLDSPAILPSLKLLAGLFQCFSNVENSKVFEVAERVLTADGKVALFQKVQDLCNQIHRLLKEANLQNNRGVIEACFQCWFDMHRFGEPVYEVLYESAKISSLRSIRDDKTHEESVAVHRAFGDIFMAYEAYKRDSEQRKYQTSCQRELQEQAQQFDLAKEALEKRSQQHAVEMQQEIQKCEHQLAEERRSREDLEQKCRDQMQQLVKEKRRGEDLAQTCQDREQQLAEEKRSREDLEQKCHDQKQQLAKEKRRGEDLAQTCQDREQQLAEERKRREELERELQGKEQELAAEKKRAEDSQQQLEQRYREKERHDQEMRQLQAEIQHREEEYGRQAIQINKLEEQLRLVIQNQTEEQRSSSPDTFPSTSLYPTRQKMPTLIAPDSQKAFWERNMASLLRDVHGVRTKVGELFRKVQGGSGSGDWEHLLRHVNLGMDASRLEAQPPGDILLQIVQFWEKKECVTVSRFCQASMAIGIYSVANVLQEVEQNDLHASLRDSSLDSEPHNV